MHAYKWLIWSASGKNNSCYQHQITVTMYFDVQPLLSDMTLSHCYLCSRSLSRLLLSSLVIASVPVRMLVNLVFKTCNSSNIIDTIVTELFAALVIVIIARFLQLQNRRAGALP